uniref:Uncharacterized protein n=1 Tax=Lotharella globosa TaxID=91324 RepID=A0A7S3Z250_9EUKA
MHLKNVGRHSVDLVYVCCYSFGSCSSQMKRVRKGVCAGVRGKDNILYLFFLWQMTKEYHKTPENTMTTKYHKMCFRKLKKTNKKMVLLHVFLPAIASTRILEATRSSADRWVGVTTARIEALS